MAPSRGESMRNMALEEASLNDVDTAVRNPTPYVKAMIMTLILTYPYLALLNQLVHLDPQDFRSCSKEECVFIRYMGWTLPSSRIQHLASLLHQDADSLAFDLFPRYVSVRNGFVANQSSLWEHVGLFELGFVVMETPFQLAFAAIGSAQEDFMKSGNLQFEIYPSAVCPGMTRSAMMDYCEAWTTRAAIANHLDDSEIQYLYTFSVVGWGICCVFHDFFVLAGVHEHLSLKVSMVIYAFQAMACFTAFAWSKGASQVFIAKHPDLDCGCYYQLPMIATILALSSPVLLFQMLLYQTLGIMRALQHGDYLFFTTFHVPFRIALSTRAYDPTRSLLVGTLLGDPYSHSNAPEQNLTYKELATLEKIWYYLNLIVTRCGCRLVGAMVIGPIFVRFWNMLTSPAHAWGGVERCMVLLVSSCLPFLTFWNVAFRKLPALRRLEAELLRHRLGCGNFIIFCKYGSVLVQVASMVCHVMTPVYLCLSLHRSMYSDGVALNGIWSEYAAGTYIFASMWGAWILKFQRPLETSLKMRLLQKSTRLRPETWPRFAEEHREFALGLHGDLASRFLEDHENPDCDMEAQFGIFLAPYRKRMAEYDGPHTEAASVILPLPVKCQTCCSSPSSSDCEC